MRLELYKHDFAIQGPLTLVIEIIATLSPSPNPPIAVAYRGLAPPGPSGSAATGPIEHVAIGGVPDHAGLDVISTHACTHSDIID